MDLETCNEKINEIDDTIQKINIAMTIDDPIVLLNILISQLKTKVTVLEVIE